MRVIHVAPASVLVKTELIELSEDRLTPANLLPSDEDATDHQLPAILSDHVTPESKLFFSLSYVDAPQTVVALFADVSAHQLEE
jgi:hypothetical protein